MERLAPYWKAVVGFFAPGAVSIAAAVTDASDGGTLITAAEWITAACAMVITAAAVYAVPNKPAAGGVVRPPNGGDGPFV